MFTARNKGIRILKITLQEAIPNEDTVNVKTRAQLECDLSASEIKKLPQIDKAVSALLKSSEEHRDDDGPNSVHVSIRLAFDVMRYKLSCNGVTAGFDGSVHGRPRVAVVKGAVALRWDCECIIDLETLDAMSRVVGLEDGCTMTTSKIQLPLFEEKEAA